MKIRVAAAAAFVLTAATAAPASGAVVLLDRSCYREGQPATFTAAGFQPQQAVTVSLDGRQLAIDNVDATGKLVAQIDLGTIPKSQVNRTLSIAQVNNLTIAATKTFAETKLYVVTKPGSFRPGRRLRIRAGGFYGAGQTLYGHVRGPKKRNLRIGRVKGPCGKVSATKKRILKKRDGPGFYVVQFDTARRFAGVTVPQFRRAYTIRRVIRFSRASSFSSPVFPSRASDAYLH